MRVAPEHLHRFIVAFLKAHGTADAPAEAVARHMVWCETVGRGNFGIERLPILVKRLKAGVLAGDGRMTWQEIGPSTARLDAGNGFGYDAAERGMARAIELARATGIGAVGVRNSNFFGAGAYFVNQAAEAGMIGLAMSNSFPKVVAHGGLKAVVGTNPMAFGAPRRDGNHLLIDMATSALAGSTVREHQLSGKPLPEGLAIDAAGQPITDPAKAGAGALLPFGGAKGFGLALIVEILAGMLTGAGVGAGVGSMYNDFTRGGDNGHFLLAIDIGRWMTAAQFEDRFAGLAAAIEASGPGARLPGAARWDAEARSRREGISLDERQWQAVHALAAAAGVDAARYLA